jgi:hypothetical protein
MLEAFFVGDIPEHLKIQALRREATMSVRGRGFKDQA